MAAYLLRRLIQSVLILLGVTVITFVLLYILPADPETSTPYKLLIEVNQPGDAHGPHADQPSLVHAVEIDIETASSSASISRSMSNTSVTSRGLSISISAAPTCRRPKW